MKQQLCSEIKEIIVRELNLNNVTAGDIADDQPLFGDQADLGLDSLDALQLAVALEEHFHTKIPEGEKNNEIFATVESIAAFILSVSDNR